MWSSTFHSVHYSISCPMSLFQVMSLSGRLSAHTCTACHYRLAYYLSSSLSNSIHPSELSSLFPSVSSIYKQIEFFTNLPVISNNKRIWCWAVNKGKKCSCQRCIWLSTLCTLQQYTVLYTDKKEKKFKLSSYIRKFRRNRLQSQIWLTASSYMVKYCNLSHLNFLI
jgi:hypothetical protein